MERKYITPDWSAPFDVDAALARVPTGATVRGLYFQDLARFCADVGKPAPSSTPKRIAPWGTYPTIDYMKAVIETGEALAPGRPLREGVRKVGQNAFPALAQSLVGKVVFGVLGKDFPAIIRLTGKALEMSVSHGRAKTLEVSPGRCVVRFENILHFLDTFEIGAVEGILDVCNLKGTVRIHKESEVTGDMLVEWNV